MKLKGFVDFIWYCNFFLAFSTSLLMVVILLKKTTTDRKDYECCQEVDIILYFSLFWNLS